MNLKGSRTEKNLMIAFAGESQARNRYTFYASKAKKEGFVQIAAIFEETANQEKSHAKNLFRFMTGGETEVTCSFPFGTIGDTIDNLRASAAGENHEWTTMYPEFEKIAREEGFEEIAGLMRSIAVAEKQHEKRYLALATNIEEGKVFTRADRVTWICRHCGYVYEGKTALVKCPACSHPQAHFELLVENW